MQTEFDLAALRILLTKLCKQSALDIYCFDLLENYEEIVPLNTELPLAIVKIIKHFLQKDRLEDFVNLVKKDFPNADWQSTYVGKTDHEKPKTISPTKLILTNDRKSVQKDAPCFYWHHLGHSEDEWWQYLVNRSEISASFDNQVGDKGERLLKQYKAGDTVIMYSSGFGAIGWGCIERPESYYLVKASSSEDKLNGFHLHRLKITWKAVANSIKDAISADRIRSELGIYHPVGTAAKIDPEKAQRLIEWLNREFPTYQQRNMTQVT